MNPRLYLRPSLPKSIMPYSCGTLEYLLSSLRSKRAIHSRVDWALDIHTLCMEQVGIYGSIVDPPSSHRTFTLLLLLIRKLISKVMATGNNWRQRVHFFARFIYDRDVRVFLRALRGVTGSVWKEVGWSLKRATCYECFFGYLWIALARNRR